MTNWGRQHTAATLTPAGVIGECGQVMLDIGEGDSLAGLLGGSKTWQAYCSTASTLRTATTADRLWRYRGHLNHSGAVSPHLVATLQPAQ